MTQNQACSISFNVMKNVKNVKFEGNLEKHVQNVVSTNNFVQNILQTIKMNQVKLDKARALFHPNLGSL